MCLVITSNSRLHDVASVECYVDQSTISFIHDAACVKRHMNDFHLSVWDGPWSKMVSSKSSCWQGSP